MTGKKQQRTSKALWNLAQRQHGVVTRAQLLAHGLTAAAIEHRLAKGRLYRLWRGVYAVGRPEVSEKGRWMAAVLSCGSQALLSHRNAGALWGVTSGISGIEVTVPGGRDRRRPVFVSIDEQTSGLSIAASSTGSQ